MIANVKAEHVDGVMVFRDKSGDEIFRLDGNLRLFYETVNPSVRQLRTRVTAAQVNAGLTLLAAVAGYQYRLIDCTLIAIGGNAGTATSVDINATQSSAVVLIAAAVAALTRSTVVKHNTADLG